MTKSRRCTLKLTDDPTCPCGEGPQTVHHLLYDCVLAPPIPWGCLLWRSRPSAWSDALLCDPMYDQELKKQWRTMCNRAVSLVQKSKHWDGSERKEGVVEHADSMEFDSKGHSVCVTDCGAFTYCAPCHITRCFRDAKFIAVKRCTKEGGVEVREGERREIEGHTALLSMSVWKKNGRRPQYSCDTCGLKWWATATPKVCTGT